MPSAFWDKLKPSVRPPAATKVELAPGGAELWLDWEDGATTKAKARVLRQHCPCAECVEEWSGRRTFEPEAISETLTIAGVHPIGNYALSFNFGDGHSTGIFQWTTLRELSTSR